MKNGINLNKKKGFSLLETIVVIAVVAIVLPAIFSIIFSILQQQIRIYRLTEVKREGDYALNTIQTLLRTSANSLYISNDTTLDNPAEKVCADTTTAFTNNNGESLYFKGPTNTWFQFYISSTTPEQILYKTSTAPGSPNSLTSTRVKILPGTFKIACKRGSTSAPPIITIEYKVAFNTSVAGAPVMPYRTTIVLRNY